MRRGKGMQEAGPAHQTAHITLPWLVDKTPRPFSPSLFGQRRAAAARLFSVRRSLHPLPFSPWHRPSLPPLPLFLLALLLPTAPPAILLSIASLHPPRSCAPAPSQIDHGS
uniref:Uncharacterized protein n=1 Tax=Setaria viridis TaxID=4556 RepID=A0A4U6UTT2_SETVI|nr:hypothetical protein SEVIR_4G057900v2 [Setaria viridis]